MGYLGFKTGNGEKLSNSQAYCLAQLCLAAAQFFPFPVLHPMQPLCTILPAEADKVWDDDAVAAGGEEGDEAVEGLRPEGLSVQAQDHLEEGKRHGILSQEVQGGPTRLYSGIFSIIYAV